MGNERHEKGEPHEKRIFSDDIIYRYNDSMYMFHIARKHRKDKCEHCYSKDKLQAHHINLNSYDHRKKNIMTLCASCHMKLHHKIRKDYYLNRR